MPKFRMRAIEVLKNYFPSTLYGYDATYGNGNRGLKSSLQICQVINVARESNALELLPCAFYLLCHHKIQHMFLIAGRIISSERDLYAVVTGREELIRAKKRYNCSFLYLRHPSDSCFARDRCQAALDRNFGQFLEQDGDLSPAVLEPIVSLEKTDYCCMCSQYFASTSQAARIAAWDKLPEWFGMESWKILRDMQSM